LIVDGNPRSLREAELMKDAFEWYEWKDTRAIVLDISEQEAFDRLTKRRICKACGRLIPWVGNFKEMKICDECGGELITRADDNPEAIKARLAYYKKDVEPAIDYYEKCMVIYNEVDDKLSQSLTGGNLAACYNGLNEYDKAIELLKNPIAIAESINEKAHIAKHYSRLYDALYGAKRYEESISWLKKLSQLMKRQIIRKM